MTPVAAGLCLAIGIVIGAVAMFQIIHHTIFGPPPFRKAGLYGKAEILPDGEKPPKPADISKPEPVMPPRINSLTYEPIEDRSER